MSENDIYKTEAEAKKAITDSAREVVVEVVVSTVLGQKLDNPLTGYVIAKQFASPQEVKDAGEWPNDAQVVKIVNTKLYNNARQSATVRMSAAERERVQETPEYRRSEMIKNIMAGNKKLSLAKAEAMADSILAAE